MPPKVAVPVEQPSGRMREWVHLGLFCVVIFLLVWLAITEGQA